MLEFGLKTLLAYLLGTLLGSLILGRLRGVDIRTLGSGNAGATNALRTQGKLFAFAVLTLDILKGAAAVSWLPALNLPGVTAAAGISREWLPLICGLAAIVGHVYPVWFGFRGGKGVATVVGVIGALDPHLLIPLFVCWLVVVALTGYVGLASMSAGVALVAAVRYLQPGNAPLLAFCILTAVFVIFTHRGNVARMTAGTEPRAQALWLFRSRTP